MSDDLIELEGGETPPEPAAAPKRVVAKTYDPKIAEQILFMIADGKTLREIEKLDGMPTKSTVQRWIMKYPELTQAWKAAREMSAASLEEEALDMARDLHGDKTKEFTGTRIRAWEVAMNQFRWSAAHRDPSQFGQTAQPNIVVPVQIITSLDIGQGGVQARVQQNTYELAAKINQEYDAGHAQIEGTDYSLEQGKQGKTRGPGDGSAGATDTSETPFAPLAPKGLKLAAEARKPGGRPRKGHKTAEGIQKTLNRRKKI